MPLARARSKLSQMQALSMTNALFRCKRKVLNRIQGSPFAPAVKSASGKQTQDVVVKGEKHQANQDDQPHLVRNLAFSRAEWAALYDLDQEEEQVPAVQNRYGKQIQNGQAHADGSGQKDDVAPPVIRLSTDLLCDAEGPGEAFRYRDGA